MKKEKNSTQKRASILSANKADNEIIVHGKLKLQLLLPNLFLKALIDLIVNRLNIYF